MPSVADLLAASRAAHAAYRLHQPRMGSVRGQLQQIPGDPVASRAALDEAAMARKAADDLDPDRLDPAWASDDATIGNHDRLRTFYAEALAKPTPADVLKDEAARRPASKKPVDTKRANGQP